MLEVQEAVGSEGGLADEVEELRRREGELRTRISEDGVEGRKRRALAKVAMLAGRLLPELDTERPDDPIELSVTDLAIKVRGQRREDYLWEIGSGANWLSYHLAISLALQEFCLGRSANPVPSFIVYDQPSQVYFPQRLAASRSKDAEEEQELVLGDEDAEAVRKVFRVVGKVVDRLNGRLQALVLEHAGANVWGGLPGIHVVEEWRGGRKLVPREWMS